MAASFFAGNGLGQMRLKPEGSSCHWSRMPSLRSRTNPLWTSMVLVANGGKCRVPIEQLQGRVTGVW